MKALQIAGPSLKNDALFIDPLWTVLSVPFWDLRVVTNAALHSAVATYLIMMMGHTMLRLGHVPAMWSTFLA